MPVANEKLREAAFFLELFQVAEQHDDPFTSGATQDEEASYLFGAILGSFYAALYQWHRQTRNNRAYQAFKLAHPEVHGSTEQGGLRSLTVHRRHVAMSKRATAQLTGAEANQMAQLSSTLVEPVFYPAGAVVHVARYYVQFRGAELAAHAFCSTHHETLQQLLVSHDPPTA